MAKTHMRWAGDRWLCVPSPFEALYNAVMRAGRAWHDTRCHSAWLALCAARSAYKSHCEQT